MTYSEKASSLIELSGIEKPQAWQREKYSRLRDELAAVGLDPQHTKGLTYRALVYDYRTMIENYLNLRDAKKDTEGTGYRLKSLGININNTKQLRTILNGFKTAVKDAARQSDYDHVKPARKAREDYDAKVQEEIRADREEKAKKDNAEAVQMAAELCEEAKEAQATRELMSDESFTAWLTEAFTSAADAAAATT